MSLTCCDSRSADLTAVSPALPADRERQKGGETVNTLAHELTLASSSRFVVNPMAVTARRRVVVRHGFHTLPYTQCNIYIKDTFSPEL